MASQALYLKWRPQTFDDVVGQAHVTQTLKNALRGGRISHAYLFAGPRGTGKTTMARLLAKAVNCLDPDVTNRPCNKCAMCQAVNDGTALDLIEMDAASHTGVDNVREAIRDKVGFRPTAGRYKVYVIDEVHMLSTSAFNALLKTLEEPPEHVIFCLATTEPHKILPTILSRCQRFDFRRIPVSALSARLEYVADREGIRIEPDALEFIARTSTGSARDAISLLDQLTVPSEVVTLDGIRSVLGLSDEQLVRELVICLAERKRGAGLDVLHRVAEQGVDMRQFTQQVVDYMRSLLLARVAGDSASVSVFPMQAGDKRLVDRFTIRELVRSIKLFNQAQLDLRGSDQNRLALELAFVEATITEDVPAEEAVSAGSAPPFRQREESGDRRKRSDDAQTLPSPPAAPPRREPEVSESRGGSANESPEKEVPADGSAEAAVRAEELNASWDLVKQAIKSESTQAEALVNSALSRDIENANRVVLTFASELLASKLEKEENKRIIESALSRILEKPCRVRGEVAGASPPAAKEAPLLQNVPLAAHEMDPRTVGAHADTGGVEATGSRDSIESGGEEDPFRKAAADPVVQDLVSRGGKITDVQLLSEE